MMFYDDYLPAEMKDKLSNYYKTRRYLINDHKNDFNTQTDKYFIKANEYLISKKNKHLKYLKENRKYRYDDTFTYLEQEKDLIVMYQYYIDKLITIMFYEVNTNSYYCYAAMEFKRTDVVMMIDPYSRYTIGFNDKWGLFYNHYQRLYDDESIKILKNIQKFKYIPLEKFEKINYFRLLNANSETIYNYEILLKFGAIKVATELMISGNTLDQADFSRYKEKLKQNCTLTYILFENRALNIAPNFKAEKPKYEDEKLNRMLNHITSTKKSKWNYGNYLIKVPKSIEEVNLESENLNHCLYSRRKEYLSRMKNRDSLILFMRRKENPDEPFFTIEIKGKVVNQIRTNNNATDPMITETFNSFYTKHKKEIMELYK